MSFDFAQPTRRQLILGSAACAIGVNAKRAWSAPTNRAVLVSQLVDVSAAQQDVSKDFLIGARAAVADINSRRLAGRFTITHEVIEISGSSAEAAQTALRLQRETRCSALIGTVGDSVAIAAANALAQSGKTMPHIAPWLQSVASIQAESILPVFASRNAQIRYALRSLHTVGAKEFGVVYADAQLRSANQAEVTRATRDLKLVQREYLGSGELAQLGAGLPATAPATLLFIGGTPELIDFAQGLRKQSRQRFLIGLADVNLQSIYQLGIKGVNVAAMQVVPSVTSGLSLVREYRAAMQRYFDEPAVAQSLAGYVAMRATAAALDKAGSAQRDALVEFISAQPGLDLAGVLVGSTQRQRIEHVTQSMLGADGRVVS
jgi:ABC-type branched-subunit amino acid transport system substrate-binding protein